jgi:hypothetical protein
MTFKFILSNTETQTSKFLCIPGVQTTGRPDRAGIISISFSTEQPHHILYQQAASACK